MSRRIFAAVLTVLISLLAGMAFVSCKPEPPKAESHKEVFNVKRVEMSNGEEIYYRDFGDVKRLRLWISKDLVHARGDEQFLAFPVENAALVTSPKGLKVIKSREGGGVVYHIRCDGFKPPQVLGQYETCAAYSEEEYRSMRSLILYGPYYGLLVSKAKTEPVQYNKGYAGTITIHPDGREEREFISKDGVRTVTYPGGKERSVNTLADSKVEEDLKAALRLE